MQVSVLPIGRDAENLQMSSLQIHLSKSFWNFDILLVQKAILEFSGLSKEEVFISTKLSSASSKSILSCLPTNMEQHFERSPAPLALCFCLFSILPAMNVAKTFVVLIIYPYYFELINDLKIRSEWTDSRSSKRTILDLRLNWIDGPDTTEPFHIWHMKFAVLLTSSVDVADMSQFMNQFYILYLFAL